MDTAPAAPDPLHLLFQRSITEAAKQRQEAAKAAEGAALDAAELSEAYEQLHACPGGSDALVASMGREASDRKEPSTPRLHGVEGSRESLPLDAFGGSTYLRYVFRTVQNDNASQRPATPELQPSPFDQQSEPVTKELICKEQTTM